MQQISAKQIADALLQYICIHGHPTSILTDRGTQFMPKAFEKINQALGIKLNHTTTNHPQANAITERINAAIKSSIKALISEGHSLKDAVRLHQALYNDTPHETTGYTPNIIHFGRSLSNIFHVYHPGVRTINLNGQHYVNKTLTTIDIIFNNVFHNSLNKQQYRNNKYNQKAKLWSFAPGDMVYVKSRSQFKPSYNGPYRIIKQNSPVRMLIQRDIEPRGAALYMWIVYIKFPTERVT